MSKCPWCDAPEIQSHVVRGNPRLTQMNWGCGSWKRGPEPWQSPECRVNELEAELANAGQERDDLSVKLAEAADERVAFTETISEQEERMAKLRLLFGQLFVVMDGQEPGD